MPEIVVEHFPPLATIFRKDNEYMCAVSMIIDYERNKWPILPKPWDDDDNTNKLKELLDEIKKEKESSKPRDPTPEEIKKWVDDNKYWSQEKFNQLMKLIEEAKRMDAMHGEADCEDPLKVKFLEELEELMNYMKKVKK
jgi:iron-sulfur cluster repair protein YtfE (RIC family)